MKKLSLLSLVLLSSIILAGCGAQKEPEVEDPAKTALAECITEAGLTMYGTEWCSHCKDQKALFGPSFASIDYVDCDASRPKCEAAGVEGFPTWKDKAGNAYPGSQPIERLAGLAGCEG